VVPIGPSPTTKAQGLTFSDELKTESCISNWLSAYENSITSVQLR
jgi:hypothetical protein